MRRVQSLSTQLIDRLNRFSLQNWTRSTLFIFFAVLAFSSACTNIGGASRNPSSEIELPNPNEGANSGAFKLVTVLPSQVSAGTLYDMVGNNSEFDTFCTGSYGVCKCEYTWNGSTVDESDVTYQESNLIRCSSPVPSGINTFSVRIIVKPAATTSGTATIDYASNSISVNLSSGTFAGSDSYLDLSNAQSFVPVERFQCRRRTFIANPLDSGIVDPIQSEDPKIIYPFNFYTTNPSEGLLRMQQIKSQEWECTLTATQDRSLHWWANPYVYSASPCTTSFCAGDSELMDPTTTLKSGKVPVSNPAATGKRRASFAVASRSYGVFQIPIKAAVGPKDFVSSNYAVIGYGAKPIPNTAGSSSCPNITLPPNATWVKLWNFRATDITSPRYVLKSNSMSMSAIMCNPKTNSSVFPSCDVNSPASVTPGTFPFGTGLDSAGTSPFPGTMASRVAALVDGAGTTNACYNIDTDWIGNATEMWTPSMYAFENSLTASSLTGLPWNLYSAIKDPSCKSTVDNVWRFTTAACDGAGWPTALPAKGVPSDPLQASSDTALLSNDNYTDQLFVVSDPNVDDSLMRNQSLAVSQYKPVTYRTSQDCNTSSRSGCPTNKEIHWDVNVKEVGTTTGSDLYPLCVLQFYD